MLKGQVGRIFFSRIMEDEDLMEVIRQKVEEAGVKAGFFNVVGALRKATLGCYKGGKYKYVSLDGPLEIASCMGNIAVGEKGEVIVHAHIVVSNEKGEAFGGHLKDSLVGATAELVVIEAVSVKLLKTFDKKTKLNLLKLD